MYKPLAPPSKLDKVLKYAKHSDLNTSSRNALRACSNSHVEGASWDVLVSPQNFQDVRAGIFERVIDSIHITSCVFDVDFFGWDSWAFDTNHQGTSPRITSVYSEGVRLAQNRAMQSCSSRCALRRVSVAPVLAIRGVDCDIIRAPRDILTGEFYSNGVFT